MKVWDFLQLIVVQSVLCYITPCTQYNERHSLGDLSCYECTGIRFSKERVKNTPEYLMARERDGTWFPLHNFIPIEVDKEVPKETDDLRLSAIRGDQTRCYWCPYTMKCGHPMDFRVKCPRLGEPETSFEGFLSRHDCDDTPWQMKPERAKNEEARELDEFEDLDRLDQRQYLTDRSKIMQRPLNTKTRETESLSWADSEYECYGRCEKPGQESECSPGIMKTVTKQLIQKVTYKRTEMSLKPSDTPVPCKLRVPNRSVSAMRAHGRYMALKKEWMECELLVCSLGLTGKESLKNHTEELKTMPKDESNKRRVPYLADEAQPAFHDWEN